MSIGSFHFSNTFSYSVIQYVLLQKLYAYIWFIKVISFIKFISINLAVHMQPHLECVVFIKIHFAWLFVHITVKIAICLCVPVIHTETFRTCFMHTMINETPGETEEELGPHSTPHSVQNHQEPRPHPHKAGKLNRVR